MQALVASEKEPITPLVDRLGELYEGLGVSALLVVGSSGDFFDLAHTVIGMDCFLPSDRSADARRVAREAVGGRARDARLALTPVRGRSPQPGSLDPSRGRREVKITTKGRDLLLYGTHPIELRAVEQLVDESQTRAVGLALEVLRTRWMDGSTPIAELLDRLEAFLDEQGIDSLDPEGARGRHPGALARPRRFEVAAALNRLRTLGVS